MPPKAEKVVPVPSGPLVQDPEPEFFAHRIAVFEKLKAAHEQQIAEKPRDPITVQLPNDKTVPGKAWETTPFEIARAISKSLAERTVIARVDGDLWDMSRPLEADCKLEFLDFNDDEGKKVYWHSSAHILGEAAEKRFGCHLCIGPPTEDGFFYDFGMPEDHKTVNDADQKALGTIMDSVIKEKQPFERLTLSKGDLLDMFKFNSYKQHLISTKIPDGESTTVYRCGPLIDLCRGPHVTDTGRIKAHAVLKHSASYFLGDPNNDSLQRVYGISFPDKKLLAEHMKFLEEAAKKDHRRIGQDQELFFFHKMSPGSPFFLPHGLRIYNALRSLIVEEYQKRDYLEVMSPNMFNSDLWKASGHWQHYKDDMFTLEIEKAQWGLKPMNCPGHCLIFDSKERSYRELPLRMAEFGILHRNEASGALSGLTRVRRFIQDDTHIFCQEDQIGQEISDLFDFLERVYGILGMQFKLKLSTRPDTYLGEIETWDRAEKTLQTALDEFSQRTGDKWELNPGDGAFYGPKIDITIRDALRRWHQFNLSYMTAGATEAPSNEAKPTSAPGTLPPGYARPVMIHRAVLGSFERFIATLCEHFAGKWPMWLSPRQILVVPVMTSADSYVKEVSKVLKEKGFYVDSDLGANTMNKKIRNGQVLQYNFIFVLGAKEMEDKTVSIRARDSKGELTTLPLTQAVEKLVQLRDSRSASNSLE